MTMLRKRPGSNAIDTTRGFASDLEVGSMFVRENRLWTVLLLVRGNTRVTVGCSKYNWKLVRRVFSFELTEPLRLYLP